MDLEHELHLPRAIENERHKAVIEIVLTGALLTKEGDRLLRPFGLTDAQFNVLMLLRYQTIEGAVSQSELGRMLLVNRSNVTGLVDRMEQAGWVRRGSQAGDRRVNRIELTPLGRKLLARAEKAYFEAIDMITGNLASEDLAQLSLLLGKLRSGISRQ